MIRIDSSPLPEGDVDTSKLGADDVADILALIALTKPGPFRPRTIELGTYIGIREGGQLIAMAGERTWVGDCREVSAICTHPDAQGRGYARALTGRVSQPDAARGRDAVPARRERQPAGDRHVSLARLHSQNRISAAAHQADRLGSTSIVSSETLR